MFRFAINHTFNVSTNVILVDWRTVVLDVGTRSYGKIRRDNAFMLNRYKISVCEWSGLDTKLK